MVKLKIAHMHHEPGGGGDAETDRIRDRMANMKELDMEGTQNEGFPGLYRV